MFSRRALLRHAFFGGAALAWPRALRAESAGLFYTPAQFDAAMTADPGEMDLRLQPGQIRGAIPGGLRGATYLINGPARLRLGGQTLHPFD